MKKTFLFAVLTLFLISFTFAIPITGSTVGVANSENSQANNSDAVQTQNSEKQAIQHQGKVPKIKVQEKNRLKIKEGECPENCTCTGSTTKCQLQNGREMTITAGNSGNVIVQVKGEQMRTQVELYKSEEKIYGVFKGNQTKEVKMMPDKIKEKLREKIKAQLENSSIELNEDGDYQIQAQKRARFFWVIPIREKVKIQMNSETGEIKKIKTSWWGFLARDIKEELIVGASCGTVTPGYNDECCQNKDYDYWNSEKGECLFDEG